MRLEEYPGVLNDVSRIAVRNYKRSDGDVLCTHLRTVDFRVIPSNRILADISPRLGELLGFLFFEDCNAIIFLAPISCFDKTLGPSLSMQTFRMAWSKIFAVSESSKGQGQLVIQTFRAEEGSHSPLTRILLVPSGEESSVVMRCWCALYTSGAQLSMKNALITSINRRVAV
ncbi:hypothetical protein PILCRDRAFT_13413 [Piloderma croceum F 1598]|uniref:Uncharacterized protein n=1 Tax=Piloderma croceum (strain F 1598) TaxID=765440 RepID=A0A0C3AP38_PILCF|nr:hypothetical protein PILCRDRAFT_13413 [Piloderma croceum F 1598]